MAPLIHYIIAGMAGATVGFLVSSLATIMYHSLYRPEYSLRLLTNRSPTRYRPSHY